MRIILLAIMLLLSVARMTGCASSTGGGWPPESSVLEEGDRGVLSNFVSGG